MAHLVSASQAPQDNIVEQCKNTEMDEAFNETPKGARYTPKGETA
jgi:hypothetical protein